MTSTVVGVDGTRDGWIAIAMSEGGRLSGGVSPTFRQLLDSHADASIVAVDVPIGAPDVEHYPRLADVQAEAMIHRRRSSVFRVPIAEALAASTYTEANEISRRHGLPGISQQAWALAPKIRDVEPHGTDPRVREIHPEVSFAALAGGPVFFSKRTWKGFRERMQLLSSASLDPTAVTGDLGRASVDDVLDALVAMWSARRIADGAARSLPPDAAFPAPAIWY